MIALNTNILSNVYGQNVSFNLISATLLLRAYVLKHGGAVTILCYSYLRIVYDQRPLPPANVDHTVLFMILHRRVRKSISSCAYRRGGGRAGEDINYYCYLGVLPVDTELHALYTHERKRVSSVFCRKRTDETHEKRRHGKRTFPA